MQILADNQLKSFQLFWCEGHEDERQVWDSQPTADRGPARPAYAQALLACAIFAVAARASRHPPAGSST
jgi:hypothetical protein